MTARAVIARADDELTAVNLHDREVPPGRVAAERCDDLRFMLDADFAAWLAERGIATVSYAEAPPAYA
jgi:hypothetical protein